MLDNSLIQELEKKLIVENSPYPHIATTNILPIDIVKKAENEFLDFKKLNNSGGYRYGNLHRYFAKFDDMPSATKEIISFFYSNNFLEFLNKKFKFNNIVPDWRLWGGGMHTSRKGGHLTVHSDFIYQRKTNTKRVLNLLLYLNSDWENDWGGHIELWNKNMTKKEKQLSPLINNCLIFRTDKDSNHGYPDPLKCPENVTRKSIALYYYIEEKSILPIKIRKRKYFATVWKKRPNSNDPEFMDRDNLWRKIKFKYLPRIYLKK
jgi:Rps23 Pro-64 3,4-dihydroxylase Tpa1-like proline 4-hydroxylase